MSKMEKKKKRFGKLLVGIGIGAALGVMFAPKAGKETRKELKEKINILFAKLKNIDAAEVKETIETKIKEIQTGLSELDKEKVLTIAKKQGAKIREKADELVAYAIEKGTPVLEKAADAVREKAIQVTKEVLEKLENKGNDKE